MNVMLILKGFIRDASYSPQLAPHTLATYALADFDVNSARHMGLISVDGKSNALAYARWISPKRTRSYPFARLYDIFSVKLPYVAIIPIIKDEGADTANNDRINYMTFSWMNLLNIYILLVWYEDARRKPGERHRITKQMINSDYVREKLNEITQYRLTALHWNTTHFERDFADVFQRAVDSYQQISQKLNVKLHSAKDHLAVLTRYTDIQGDFDLNQFRVDSLSRSLTAATRETQTQHRNESVSDGAKNLLYLSNYLGGEYHLAPDEIYYDESGELIVQESKNSTTGVLPSRDDVKDGLFKLILYSSLERISVDGVDTQFRAQLKMTGKFQGRLALHTATLDDITDFCRQNRFNTRQTQRLYDLRNEIAANPRLCIILTGNL